MSTLSHQQTVEILIQINKVTKTHVPLAVISTLTGKSVNSINAEYKDSFYISRKTIGGSKVLCFEAKNFDAPEVVVCNSYVYEENSALVLYELQKILNEVYEDCCSNFAVIYEDIARDEKQLSKALTTLEIDDHTSLSDGKLMLLELARATLGQAYSDFNKKLIERLERERYIKRLKQG